VELARPVRPDGHFRFFALARLVLTSRHAPFGRGRARAGAASEQRAEFAPKPVQAPGQAVALDK